MFHIPSILIDPVYTKDENYYPKVFLEKFIHNFFLEKYKKFWFLRLCKFILKHKKNFKIGARKFIFLRNIRNFLRMGSFHFCKLRKLLGNIRKFHFQGYKKNLF